MSSQRFTKFWAAETIRQQELDSGPLADDAASRRAQIATSAENFVLQRATHLAETQQLIPALHSYQQKILAGLWLAFIFACISGASLALNLAPQSARDISLIEAVSVVILANLLFMLVWLVTMLRRQSPRGVGYWLQYYMHKFIRDSQHLAVAQSYTQLCAQQGLLKPAFSSISHGIWASILGAAVVVLTLRFIAYDYQFVWQTTLLSTQQISTLIEVMHIVPGLFGIERPIVDSTTQISTDSRATAIWLLSCILLYALLPRVVLFIASEWVRRRRLRRLELDWTKPGYAQLRTLFASGSTQEIDPAPANIEVLSTQTPSIPPSTVSDHMLMTLELPDEIAGRLASKACSHDDLSWSTNINSASDRRQWLNNLAARRNSASQVLLVINPLLSPDRGSIRFIEALTYHAHLSIIIGLQHSVRGKLWIEAVQTHLPETSVLTNTHFADNSRTGDLPPSWANCLSDIEEIIDAWKV